MDKAERQRLGGDWLRRTRPSRGFATAKALAEAMEVDPSIVSRIELGQYAVDDDRADQIATALRMDILEVRRGLRMWLGREDSDVPEPDEGNEITQLRGLLLDALNRIDRLEGQQGTG